MLSEQLLRLLDGIGRAYLGLGEERHESGVSKMLGRTYPGSYPYPTDAARGHTWTRADCFARRFSPLQHISKGPDVTRRDGVLEARVGIEPA